MGLFDSVRCNASLPIEGMEGVEWKTQDTPAQQLDQYEIREDGTLWHLAYDIVDRSNPDAEGIARFAGMATRTNARWEPENLTGEIVLHANGCEISTYFVQGNLKFAELRQAPAATRATPARKRLS